MAEKKEIKSKVLKMLEKKDTRNGQTRLMVIQWNDYPPQLVKQEYYNNENNELLPGKLKGLNASDFAIVAKNHKEIKELLTV